MYICISIDVITAIFLFLFGFGFYHSHGKWCKYIAGFNMKSIKQMKEYDVKRLCEDYGKGSIIGGILFLGAIVVDILYPGVGVTAFSIIYLILVINYFIHMQANGEKRYKNRQGL